MLSLLFPISKHFLIDADQLEITRWSGVVMSPQLSKELGGCKRDGEMCSCAHFSDFILKNITHTPIKNELRSICRL